MIEGTPDLLQTELNFGVTHRFAVMSRQALEAVLTVPGGAGTRFRTVTLDEIFA